MGNILGKNTILSFEVFLTGIMTFAILFTSLFFYKIGFSYEEIISAYPFWFLIAALTVFLIGKSKPLTLMRLGLLILVIQCLIAYFIKLSFTHLLIWHGLFGVFLSLYYCAFNTIYFREADESCTAYHSSIVFLIFPIMNVFMPFLGGLVIEKYGFKYLYLLAGFLILVFLCLTSSIKYDKVIDFKFFDLKEKIDKIKGLLLLEGFWQGVNWSVVPLISFYYFSTGLDYGVFLGYLGVTGAIASVFLSKLSDKGGKRRIYVYSAVLMVSFATVAAGFAKTRVTWIFIMGFMSFFMAILKPFTTSVLLDFVCKAKTVMVSREVYLNLGRFIGSILVLVIFMKTDSLYPSLMISGLVFAMYPILVEKSRVYEDEVCFS